MQRRLAVIVAADVVGYSRLMGVDETGTLDRLRAHRRELIDPLIATHGGRIVKTMGDGLLLEFPSVVAATRCAIETQEGLAARNADVSEDERIVFRVGVNQGDIIIDGEDILGDGVNVAARLQEVAEPGGIAVSHRVHEDVRDRLDARFEDRGEQSLKNIARPIRVWAWSPGIAPRAAPSLPDKPSIAVLPFANMSGDPEQEYFADGIAEDIITALSKFRWFFVIARNSSFTYKGSAVDVKVVGRELGVRYVLEGSVRKAGNRVRVTAQLIEAASGNHIWAERYDRELVDVFDLQDEIQQAIVVAVEPELAGAERQRAARKPPEQFDAWDLCHRAMWHLDRRDRGHSAEAESLFERAIAADPGFATAYAGYSWLLYDSAYMSFVDDVDAARNKCLALAEKAVAADDRDPFAHAQHGRALYWKGDLGRAIAETRHAVALNPNFALGYQAMTSALLLDGRYREALESGDRFVRLSPRDPLRWATEIGRGWCLVELGDPEGAETALTAAVTVASDHIPWPRVFLADFHVTRERGEAAREIVAELAAQYPELTIEHVMARWPLWPSGVRERLSRTLCPRPACRDEPSTPPRVPC